MNRVEQLTYDLLDGVLDDPGAEELQRLIDQDEVARCTHFSICEQEAALRGRLPEVDVAHQTMARLRDVLAGQARPEPAEPAWGTIPAPPVVPPTPAGFVGELPCPPPPPLPGMVASLIGPPETGATAGMPGATAGLPSSAAHQLRANTAGQAGSATHVAPPLLPSQAATPLEVQAVSPGRFSRTAVSTLLSTLFHLAAMISLALWMIPEIVEEPSRQLTATQVDPEEAVEEFEVVFLDDRLEPATELVFGDTRALLDGAADGVVELLDPAVLESFSLKNDADLLDQLDVTPGEGVVSADLPGGKRGPAQAVVGDYKQALDRITQEILRMLAKRNVLLVWCFDQSESMKDDQQEIIARIDRVYAELDLTDAARNDALLTMVTSFGKDFQSHTSRPTKDVEEIRAAINSVPIDPSGEEMMCSAVARSIAMCRGFTGGDRRRMALILVSDESGNEEENDSYLEMTIGVALAARCRVYVLGREAVFGSRYARVRWVHPRTGRTHNLPVDRGPETAFVEQLQTEGFEARTDAHPSGFGPYAQCRLAWQTGGIFFMLPSLESNLVGRRAATIRRTSHAALLARPALACRRATGNAPPTAKGADFDGRQRPEPLSARGGQADGDAA